MIKQTSLSVVIALLFALAVGMPSLKAQELSLSEADMQYDAQGASITADGDASDWADAEFKSQIPFEKGGELVLFEEYAGGTWSGVEDHSSAVAFAWDAENLYLGIVVTDDTHQNGGAAWNGDSAQIVFANAAQDTVTHLYNYGMADGEVIIHNEKGPGDTVASITRDDDTTTTLYELVFPAASLGLDAYESGMSIGVGVCVNDGDTEDGQGGQKGWSGWGPYAAVYGKTASATGLVTLVGDAPGGDLTLTEADMQYDAQGASITADGDASDWADAEFKSQIPFEKGGELVLFEEYAGGTWSGPADHSSAVAFAWDAENLYLGIVVTDDTHQNGGAAWNGDSAQIVFANAAQDTVTHLYNYGMADGEVIIHNEKGPGDTVASITRDDDTTTTLYELVFPAASLGLDAYESGMSIGVGVCVNDGDTEDGQGGQKGWSGWGPYAAVYGKTASATGLVTLVGEAPGPDLSLSEADMQYDAQGASITADGDASDWADAEFKSQIPFEKGGELVLFEEYAGGTWSGPADHSSAVAFAWDAENLYLGIVVTDDTHQNGGAAWNGDSAQIVFANAAQDTVTHLYNYGMADGEVIIHNEKGPGDTVASITRDDDTTTTLYELVFPAASLGLDAYESGMSIGVGVCVNDGDTEDGQGGQKGWSGWGPYAAVYGKTASATGLVTLVGEAPGPDLSLSEADMQYDAQGASITADGDASDWADAEFKSQIPFEKGGELVLFEEYAGGTWSGPADHSSAVAFAWDAENLYLGIVVTDDTHQNGGAAWNGDSAQIVFANAAQDTVTHLYNYGMADGEVIIHNEKGPGDTVASITRDDDTTTTLYELVFPAASLGLDAYESGMSIGVGVCVNDGDTEDGQGGQKGWSGWGPYAAVYGKTASATGLVTLVGEAPGGDLTLTEADMQYDAQGASITADGDASDWADAEFKSQIPFEKGGELVLFEEYAGGTWSGPADHSSAVAFAWDAENLYLGIVVTDDTHQNGGAAWNGDSAQIVFANAAQDTVTHLYNYGMADGEVIIHNEKGPGDTVASITRDDDTTTTLYELVFPAASLGLDAYESGMSIGVGVCVNDGDTEDGQGGQKGWSGWGPYAAVYGKTASATGLVTLVGDAPAGAPSISVVRNADGTLTVTFDGKLQAAPTVNGPWQDVTDESPYNLTPDQGQTFGRAVK